MRCNKDIDFQHLSVVTDDFPTPNVAIQGKPEIRRCLSLLVSNWLSITINHCRGQEIV